jgi:hypothetical protein
MLERCKTYEKLGKCGGICEKCIKTRKLTTPKVDYYMDTRQVSAKKQQLKDLLKSNKQLTV